LGLWYGDHSLRFYEARRAAGKKGPYGVSSIRAAVFRPDVPERFEAPPLPQAFLLPSIQYATVRSAPAYDAPWVVGVKGARPPYTHHNQPDVGAFYAHLHGQRLLMDPGYYVGQATDHCLPLINGKGPKPGSRFDGRVFSCVSVGDRQALAVDATRAYGQAAQRVRRWFVLVGQEGLVVLDDVLASEGQPSVGEAQYQAGAPTQRLNETAFRIHRPEATMDVQLFPPAETPGDASIQRLQLLPEQSLDKSGWGYKFSDCRHFPVRLRYRPREDQPLVSVILDATDRPENREPRLTHPGRVDPTGSGPDHRSAAQRSGGTLPAAAQRLGVGSANQVVVGQASA